MGAWIEGTCRNCGQIFAYWIDPAPGSARRVQTQCGDCEKKEREQRNEDGAATPSPQRP